MAKPLSSKIGISENMSDAGDGSVETSVGVVAAFFSLSSLPSSQIEKEATGLLLLAETSITLGSLYSPSPSTPDVDGIR